MGIVIFAVNLDEGIEMNEQFYLTSRHGNCGSNVMFHNIDGNGYGTNLNNLHIFTLEEAQKDLNHDIRSLPLLKTEVDKRAIISVDHQYLNRDQPEDSLNEYVIQVNNCWNGNDIPFASGIGKSYDYRKANIYTKKEAQELATEDHTIWKKSFIDSICRPTFQEENISTRKMITGAGIKYKKPRKKRAASGKTRWNCPACGKISWQFNPYDFEGCNDVCCDEYH